jgi:hypothetical protein
MLLDLIAMTSRRKRVIQGWAKRMCSIKSSRQGDDGKLLREV